MVESRPEVEWDDTERAWMLALAQWREGRCSVCGGPAEECQGEGAEWRYEAAMPVRCHRMTAILRAQGEVDREHPQALLWGARLKA